ncbi:MAG: biotin/lipoyl-binding protein [Candidatus Sulfotelmatobacter sp.]|jgi:multidrug efflux pump subunit AcrA (membrane-fusion protein)
MNASRLARPKSPDTSYAASREISGYSTVFSPKRRGILTVRGGLLCTLFGAGLALLSGCQKGAAKATAPRAPEVIVAQVSCQQVREAEEFTGRVEAVNTVEVRPRVSGYLQRVHFREGDLVHKGNLLFELDSPPFQAEVDRLSGELDLARAELARTESDFRRAERLRDNDGMSREEYDRRVAPIRKLARKCPQPRRPCVPRIYGLALLASLRRLMDALEGRR